MADYNVDEKVEEFVQAILQEHSYTKGNHIMFKMGSDFHYASANHWYKNLDKIIKYVNEKDDRFNVFYSNPTLYTYAKSQEIEVTWSLGSVYILSHTIHPAGKYIISVLYKGNKIGSDCEQKSSFMNLTKIPQERQWEARRG